MSNKTESSLATRNGVEARRHAVEQMAQHDSAYSVDLLIQALGDPAHGVRSAAFVALEQCGCADVAFRLVNILAEKNLAIRNAASALLIAMQHGAVPALCSMLRCDNHDTRKFVVDILGLIPDNGTDDSLVSLLCDKDDNVRIAAVEALGNMRSSLAVESLINIYNSVESMQIAVCEALGKIGNARAESFLLNTLRTLGESIEPDTMLVCTVLDAIALHGTEQCIVALRPLLHVDEAEIQHRVLYAMICIFHRNSLSSDELRGYSLALTAMLHSADMSHCEKAARELARFPESEVVQTLLSVAGRDAEIDRVLMSALHSRPNISEELLCLLFNKGISLHRASLILTLNIMRQHCSQLMETSTQLAEALFVQLFQLRERCGDEPRALIDDILMMIDYERAALLTAEDLEEQSY